MVVEPVNLFTVVNTTQVPMMVILTDYKYWTNHQDELDTWLAQYSDKGVYRKGSVVMFGDEKILTLFILRWQ